MTGRRFARRWFSLSLTVLVFASSASAEWKEKVLYSFQGSSSDGYYPAGGVVFDGQGNLYGATTGGGPTSCTPIGNECGKVFELTPPTQKGGSWTEALIYQFQGEGSKDGSVPTGGVIFDAAGNLYGVTAYGGTGDCVLLGIKGGCGTVYELSPPKQQGGAWTETILYSFRGGNDGYFPWGNLVFDKGGNLYGATQFGGGKGTTCNYIYGGQCGTVFKLSPPTKEGRTWTEKILHSFKSGKDGANPNGGLVLDAKGTVYGTTFGGGNESGECGAGGCGTAFALQPPTQKGGAWTERVLFRFDIPDGATPAAGVILGGNGKLYGTAYAGANNGYGAVFSLAAPKGGRGPWKEAVLYRFSDESDGAHPEGSLILDSSGNLYSTTNVGSSGSLRGNVFRLRPHGGIGGHWVHSVIHGFTGIPDGENPAANLIFDKVGNLYGTTQDGGAGSGCSFIGCGTVFEVKSLTNPE